MNITFIGLGIMGRGMAGNLLTKYQPITVFNRSPEPADDLATSGAIKAGSVREAVSNADLVITMVSTPQVVETLMLGPEGGLKGMKSGALWVDCSTVDPGFSRRCYQESDQLGIRFLDAPVTGTKPHAEAGQLSFFVGGTTEWVAEVEPVLRVMGQNVLHMGPVTSGSAYKMLLNVMLAQSMVVFSETVLLGEKLGFSRNFLLDNLPKAPVIAPFTKFKAEMMKAQDKETQFPLEWMLKDVHLANQMAYEKHQPLFLAKITEALYAKANQDGWSRSDFSAIFNWLAGAQAGN